MEYQFLQLFSKPEGETDLTYLLNERELGVVHDYDEKYKAVHGPDSCPSSDPNLVYFLGDNANYGTWSGVSGKIPTFRCNTGFYWFPFFKRFMTPRDKLSTLSMPVDHQYCQVMGVPQIEIEDSKRSSLLAGNSMNFASVGIIQMIGLSCFAKST